MSTEIVRLQEFAERFQDAAGQTDPHDRICVTTPRVPHISSEDRKTLATIRVSDGVHEEYFHTSAAAEHAVRELVAKLDRGER